MRPFLTMTAMMALNNCKLTYFNITGRGESIRLALSISGVTFTDERIPFPEWSNLKSSTPWGSLPVLTLSSGAQIAQQRAVLRFVGKETGLYPTDNLQAALVDSLLDAAEDLGAKANAQGQGLPQEEKEAARAKGVAKGGVVHGILERIESFIIANGTAGHAVGDSLTIADLFLFAATSALVSGLYDGVPLDTLDSGFPNIMAVRKTVRGHKAVSKWYDDLDESGAKMAASYGPIV